MNNSIRISYKAYFLTCVIYLVLPIIVFFLGYLRLPIAVISSLIMVSVSILAIKDWDKDPDGNSLDNGFDLPVSFLLITIIYAIIVTILTGVGELVWTTQDHAFRRAILNDLVNYDWPVIYDPATQTNPDVIRILDTNELQGFVYYFTFWTVPAVIGKLLGFTAANYTLIAWNSLGITLIIIGISMYIKRASYSSMFILLCFAGLDIVPFVLNGRLFYINEPWLWIDGCVPHMTYISNFNSLENVFNQAIPCYLIVLLLMLSQNNRNIGFTASLIFAYSPWITFGMLVPAIIQLFRRDKTATDKTKLIRNLFSPCNIVIPILMVFIYGSFYLSGSGGALERGFVITYYDNFALYLLAYVVLIVVEVLPSAGLVFTSQKKEPLYWGAIALLLLCPIYKITESNDLSMRTSLPGLFILAVFLAKKISDYTLEDANLAKEGKKRKGIKEHLKIAILSLILVCMSCVTAYMLSVIIPSVFYNDLGSAHIIESFGNQQSDTYTQKISEQFFVPNPDNTFFFGHLAK